MGDKMNREEYFVPATAPFNYNNVTGGADSASGGSAGSGMECLQLRSPPGPFHYLISEQAKSLVALQELQNEVGALLEFRDLVIETFPNLRSKMAPSTPATQRREWEPGVRVRRKLPAAGDAVRAKPQPSVQDSGFSTETSCGKDAHSSASASATRSRPIEDELWALLDVIQRKGIRLRDEAELLRGELDERNDTAEESFARVLSASECSCSDARRLRNEREELLARAAQLEAQALSKASPFLSAPATPLGRLDRVLATPPRPPCVETPDSKKFAAILHESNPVELQRQLLTSTVKTQVLSEQLQKAAEQHSALLDKLERSRDENDDLKFQLEEKTIELEGARAKVRQLENRQKTPTLDDALRSREHRDRDSMRDLEPVTIPDEPEEQRISETPKRNRTSRIPVHTAVKSSRNPNRRDSGGNSVGPRSRSGESPARPPSAHSVRSVASARSRYSASSTTGRKEPQKKASAVPVRRAATSAAPPENKRLREVHANSQDDGASYHDSLNFVTRRESDASELIAEYLTRTARLADNQLFSRMHQCRTRPLPADLDYRLAYESPQNLALELSKSILYEDANTIDVKTLKSLNSHGDSKQYSEDSLWNGKPQQYFESMKYAEHLDGEEILVHPIKEYEHDSLVLKS